MQELLCPLDILIRWRWVSAGMRVTDDDCRAIAHNSRAKDLCSAEDRTINGSPVKRTVVYDPISRIEHDDAQLLIIQIGHIQHNQGGCIGRRFYLIFFPLLWPVQPSPNLQDCL